MCCDGTWNSLGEERETNVVDLVRAIKPVGTADDGKISQIVHYHLGVGTGNILDQFFGGAIGVGLSSSVKACYSFLVDNFEDGDEIFLFGFSRGAYVVRSVAGMVGSVGLLQKSEMTCFYDAWTYYTLPRGDRKPEVLQAIGPNRRAVEIRCLGVWDTVGALGVPGFGLCSSAFRFHDTGLRPYVRHAFQALAIDERRSNFQPAIWVKSEDDPDQFSSKCGFRRAFQRRRRLFAARAFGCRFVVDGVETSSPPAARSGRGHTPGSDLPTPRRTARARRTQKFPEGSMVADCLSHSPARCHNRCERADLRRRLGSIATSQRRRSLRLRRTQGLAVELLAR